MSAPLLRTWTVVALIVTATAPTPLAAQRRPWVAAPATEDAPAAEDPRLAAARQGLVELRFEEVLATLDGLLSDAGVSRSNRTEALILRSQLHVALGDSGAAESDYREILGLRPGWEPDPQLTPGKALTRFAKLRDGLVGRLKLQLDPPDARVSIDGVPVVAAAAGSLALLAGAHSLRAEAGGFDPLELSVNVRAGAETPVEALLIPNARSVVVSTLEEDVVVRLDGREVGRTEKPVGGERLGAAELLIEHLPLGEHVFELTKPCFRSERIRRQLTVDLRDRSPLRLTVVALSPSPVSVELIGPDGAELFLDGRSVARLPMEPIERCPGNAAAELRMDGRVVWRSKLELSAGSDVLVRADPRPNAVLVGADDWPVQLAALGRSFSVGTAAGFPRSADLSTVEGWSRVSLPRDTDVAIARVAAARRGAPDGWFLYSPILGTVTPIQRGVVPERPDWARPVWGFEVVDSTVGGGTRVIRVRPEGPASAVGIAPGDRITEVGGTRVTGAGALAGLLKLASPRAPLAIEWTGGDGRAQRAQLRAELSPELLVRVEDPLEESWRAAWAMVDAGRGGEAAAGALSNLALLYGAHGRHELAAASWRRVRWPERRGVGQGTVQYYLGVELERLGRERDAARAYRAAASTEATAFHDAGPPIAPAAMDRLADLGGVAEP